MVRLALPALMPEERSTPPEPQERKPSYLKYPMEPGESQKRTYLVQTRRLSSRESVNRIHKGGYVPTRFSSCLESKISNRRSLVWSHDSH